jgi:pyruvate kinase
VHRPRRQRQADVVDGDQADAEFAMRIAVDWIALSFVPPLNE